jgi:hypothetical protein
MNGNIGGDTDRARTYKLSIERDDDTIKSDTPFHSIEVAAEMRTHVSGVLSRAGFTANVYVVNEEDETLIDDDGKDVTCSVVLARRHEITYPIASVLSNVSEQNAKEAALELEAWLEQWGDGTLCALVHVADGKLYSPDSIDAIRQLLL